jgi:hypothetical protein
MDAQTSLTIVRAGAAGVAVLSGSADASMYRLCVCVCHFHLRLHGAMGYACIRPGYHKCVHPGPACLCLLFVPVGLGWMDGMRRCGRLSVGGQLCRSAKPSLVCDVCGSVYGAGAVCSRILSLPLCGGGQSIACAGRQRQAHRRPSRCPYLVRPTGAPHRSVLRTLIRLYILVVLYMCVFVCVCGGDSLRSLTHAQTLSLSFSMRICCLGVCVCGGTYSIFLAGFCLLMSCSVGGLSGMHAWFACANDTTNESVRPWFTQTHT